MNELDFLREMFQDTRTHIGIGVVKMFAPSPSRNALRVKLTLMPENRDIIALMTFADVYQVTFPELEDLAMVAFAEGHPDEAHIIKLINTKEEKIPLFALLGHTVDYSRPGKKHYIGSDTKIGIGMTDSEQTEPLVLGTQLKNLLANILTQLSALTDQTNLLRAQNVLVATELAIHTHNITTPVPVTPGVWPTLVPNDAAAFTGFSSAMAAMQALFTAIKTQFDGYKISPVNNGMILSDIAFTEKGLPL